MSFFSNVSIFSLIHRLTNSQASICSSSSGTPWAVWAALYSLILSSRYRCCSSVVKQRRRRRCHSCSTSMPWMSSSNSKSLKKLRLDECALWCASIGCCPSSCRRGRWRGLHQDTKLLYPRSQVIGSHLFGCVPVERLKELEVPQCAKFLKGSRWRLVRGIVTPWSRIEEVVKTKERDRIFFRRYQSIYQRQLRFWSLVPSSFWLVLSLIAGAAVPCTVLQFLLCRSSPGYARAYRLYFFISSIFCRKQNIGTRLSSRSLFARM